ncbi:acylneuraminate cytidylyltransferase family protein [Albirhodobacter sp. R86504]|uniref:acylneuraminate cytidylyltransferase family protein n=1 Tax=Albirhodobacter sp. R86504 TaxID=3093848 RepID=UPI003671C516
MIIGHIGVRKGSKGVPGKNFKSFCGRPLIDWSLDQLLENKRIDCVVVSTDDADILAHAVKRGAFDMGLRPDELATDAAGKFGVWKHALGVVEDKCGAAEVFIDIDATSPMRIMADIDGALDLFLKERPDMVMNVAEAEKNPYFNLLEADASGALHVSKSLPGGVVARQQAPKVFEHAAATYVLDPAYLKRASGLFEGRVLPHIVPSERSVDIDSPIDFKIAEFLMSERLAGR